MTTKQKTSKPAAKTQTTKAKKSTAKAAHVAAEPIAQAVETLPAELAAPAIATSAPTLTTTITTSETVAAIEAPSVQNVTIETSSEKPVLTIGMLQKRLYERGFYFGHWDGHYGQLTKEAVGHFQYRNGLYPDGEATPETLAALGF
ncbi:MAG TPA: peptidoglycan-binding domain-containing protein [Oscillatoriaceae cyanobacterium]